MVDFAKANPEQFSYGSTGTGTGIGTSPHLAVEEFAQRAGIKKTLDDPAVQASFDEYDQTVIYLNTEHYIQFARNSFQAEKAAIERLGLASKG